ncbi:MAG: ParB N-terminal domain-containing protein [Deltaproteobacteria bacterium]|nr:ParB N-terminal domain-containing protein [Deltaproteobacteria bacterium]
MAARQPKKADRPRQKKRRTRPEVARGLGVSQLTAETPPALVASLAAQVGADGGVVMASFREPVGGHWHLLAGLPIDKVTPTPFQRDLSPAHVERLANVIDKLDRFVDPIVVVREPSGAYWTPNGHHRLAALRSLGAQAVVALVLADAEVAYQILALNTEKAHNVREKSLEVIRMARSLSAFDSRPEAALATEFEEAAYVTLGVCYEHDGRFSGGAYHPLLRRIDALLPLPLAAALEVRAARAQKLLALDAEVAAAIKVLKAKGFESPYLRAFVLARVNPLRFRRGATADFDDTVDAMTKAAARFDAGRVRPDQLALAAGPPEDAG